MDSITIKKPDDWHLHVRDGDVLTDVVSDTARCFARAIIMPNLKPPVINTDMALAYRHRIMESLPAESRFNPLMTLYLTDNTSPAEIAKAKESGQVYAVKYYPAGATTNSDAGVTGIEKTWAALEKMSELGMPLLVHGEVVDSTVDVFDREKYFIERTLQPLQQRFPELKIVFEHITTSEAVDFVTSAPANIAATITPHHLLYNRNAMFNKGIRPHYFCLPVLKRETHRQSLLKAATSGNRKFFLGTDSAPHAIASKENACGCAGIYSAHAAMELYTAVFEAENALERLEQFASINGAEFYGLPVNTETITLVKQEWQIPEEKKFGSEKLVPLCAGEILSWKLS